MTPMMKAFADYYIINKNGFKAAEKAGYSCPQQSAYGLLRHPEVQEYIQNAFKERTMSAHEVLDRLKDNASLDLSDIIRIPTKDNPSPIDMQKMKDLGLDRFVKTIGLDSNGNVKIEFVDPQAALVYIGKAHKMFGDSNTLGAPGGGPVSMSIQFVRPGEIPAPVDIEKALPAVAEGVTGLLGGENSPV